MAGPIVALIPIKLIKNGQAKYTRFLDTDNANLNLKIYIKYRNATQDIKIGMSERKKMITPKKIQPINNTFGYFIMTSPTSYKINVLYYLSNY